MNKYRAIRVTRRMTCCICGSYAGQWFQHSNCDDGYSICTRCVASLRSRGVDESEIRDLYGIEWYNYGSSSDDLLNDSLLSDGKAPLIIEVGHTYLTGEGTRVTIVGETGFGGTAKFIGMTERGRGCLRSIHGRFGDHPHILDLVALAPEREGDPAAGRERVVAAFDWYGRD
jgi:hypothetical protein